MTFYKQLYAQGKSYNIHLVDIESIGKGVDLCPQQVPKHERNEMALALYQKLQHIDIGGITYVKLQNQQKAQSTTCDGYVVLKQLLRHLHPKLKEGDLVDTAPKLPECDNDLYHYNNIMNDFFTYEQINGRSYSEKHKSLLYLQNIDDSRCKDAVAQCKIDLGIATIDDDTIIKQESLTFEFLPTTVAQLAKTDGFFPTVRAMTVSNKRDNNVSRGAYKQNKKYKPFQCKGCGQWGHKLNSCMTIPKISLTNKFIEENMDKVEVLIKEYLRTNNKNTKRQTIRLLMDTGTLDAQIDPQEFLDREDVHIDMMEVNFDSDNE